MLRSYACDQMRLKHLGSLLGGILSRSRLTMFLLRKVNTYFRKLYLHHLVLTSSVDFQLQSPLFLLQYVILVPMPDDISLPREVYILLFINTHQTIQ